MNNLEKTKLQNSINQMIEEVNKESAKDNWPKVKRVGENLLNTLDNLYCQTANIHKRVVAFSLFGNDPLYCETAIMNAKEMAAVYPGWQMWLYHDHTVPKEVLQKLTDEQCVLIDVKSIGIEHWPGTFWRFHAVMDPEVEYVLFRDADSVVSDREAGWVKDWLASGKPFYVMRDWFSHVDLILAGLWSAYAPLLGAMKEWVDAYLKATPKLHPTHADQLFLGQIVWPKIKPLTLLHDTVHDFEGVEKYVSPHPGPHSSDALGGFKCVLLELTLPKTSDQYRIDVKDENKALVFQYTRNIVNGKDAFHLPKVFHQRILDGEWSIDYVVLPKFSVSISPPPPKPE